MGRLRTFIAQSRQDKLAFIQAWSVFAAATLAVRLAGMSRAVSWLVPDKHVQAKEWPRAALWLPIAGKYWPSGGKCLPRSIALLALLRRNGIDAELRIGVQKSGNALDAHAWVEVKGIPVSEHESVAQRYAPFSTTQPSAIAGRVR